MKVLIAFITISCLQLVFGDCPDCDDQSFFYEIAGCTVLCRRKGCPTNYSCRKVLDKYRAKKKCFFNGQYYDVNATLPDRYSARDGKTLCTYQCIKYPGTDSYIFSEADCVPYLFGPTKGQCDGMLQISTNVVLQLNAGIVYFPGNCQISIIILSVLPPSDCVGSKCCRLNDKLYKKDRIVRVFGAVCVCSCPPVMSCITI